MGARSHTATTRFSPEARPAARPGFTILELLLALVLLDVGLLALVGLGAAISRNAAAMRATSLASNVAWSRVERMASASCSGALAATVSSAGIAEWFSDAPTANDTRTLADSVAVSLPHGVRPATARTRARC